jgi:homopolymeric O-antigen transport system permease protein
VLVCPNEGSSMRVVQPAAAEDIISVPHKVLALGGALLWLPLLFLLQGIFTVGLGYFLSAFNLILRDTYHVIGVVVMVWMFSTPIFYPPYQVMDSGWGWLLQANPMYWLIDSYREVLLFNTAPNLALLARFALVACVVFGVGASFFQSQRDRFPDLL